MTDTAETIQFVLGFAEYAAEHPEVGQPLMNEAYLGDSFAYQQTTKGKLEYYGQSNTVAFYPKGGG